MRCAYVSGFVDLREVDVLVQIGCGYGEHAEALHMLYPHLTLVLCDVPPRLYVAHQLLTIACPDATVDYRSTRSTGPLALAPGHIYFVTPGRLGTLPAGPGTLFWHAADGPDPPIPSVDSYARLVHERARWLYLSQSFDAHGAREACTVHWERYRGALQGFELTDRRVGPSYFDRGTRVDDAFWTRVPT
jgi:putative sugar O-methyltransferase